MNPFNSKITEFSEKQREKNNTTAHDVNSAKAGDIFADKPFTVEYRGIYKAAQVGQTVAQVITFCTTAALGVFALNHVIPLSWGVYVSVPIALLFAFGVEKIKRGTLNIAAKYYLKYGQLGAVGFAAIVVMGVSIAAALYGAGELPDVVYPKVKRTETNTEAQEIQKQIDNVQADILRLQTKLNGKKRGTWVAENETLPALQAQRAELQIKKTEAQERAGENAALTYTEAAAERDENAAKMRRYSVGSAIVAEVIFFICTGFILYYLFCFYIEQQSKQNDQVNVPAPTAANGQRYTIAANLRTDENRLTKIVPTIQSAERTCEYCNTPYVHRHAKQRFCSEKCRVSAWEQANGKTLKRTGNK